jgi:hypothetical protein
VDGNSSGAGLGNVASPTSDPSATNQVLKVTSLDPLQAEWGTDLSGGGTIGNISTVLDGDVSATWQHDHSGAVTGTVSLVAESVDSDQYVDGSIDAVHLADDAVTADKLDETGFYTVGGITNTGTLTVNGAATFSGSLTMAAGVVDTSELADDAVTADKLTRLASTLGAASPIRARCRWMARRILMPTSTSRLHPGNAQVFLNSAYAGEWLGLFMMQALWAFWGCTIESERSTGLL